MTGIRQVIPEGLIAKQAALRDYSDAVVNQRNEMGTTLEHTAEEVEVERKRREEVAARLAVLQSRVCSR